MNQPRECGFTLIEVLVAIVVLTLAASGVAVMQLHALRMVQQSGFQTSATQFAAELAEIMRAHGQPASSAHHPFLFSFQAKVGTNTSVPSVAQDWQRRLQQALPRARVVVCRDGSPVAADTLRWACDHASDAAIVIKIGWATREAAWSASPASSESPEPETPPGVALVVEG